MKAKLILVAGKADKSVIRLKLPTIVGRARDAGLMIRHPTVSRRHCEIFEADGALFVRDLGALNGTLVDDVAINKEASLKPGHTLTVGPLTFRAVYEYAGSPTLVSPLSPINQSTNTATVPATGDATSFAPTIVAAEDLGLAALAPADPTIVDRQPSTPAARTAAVEVPAADSPVVGPVATSNTADELDFEELVLSDLPEPGSGTPAAELPNDSPGAADALDADELSASFPDEIDSLDGGNSSVAKWDDASFDMDDLGLDDLGLDDVGLADPAQDNLDAAGLSEASAEPAELDFDELSLGDDAADEVVLDDVALDEVALDDVESVAAMPGDAISDSDPLDEVGFDEVVLEDVALDDAAFEAVGLDNSVVSDAAPESAPELAPLADDDLELSLDWDEGPPTASEPVAESPAPEVPAPSADVDELISDRPESPLDSAEELSFDELSFDEPSLSESPVGEVAESDLPTTITSPAEALDFADVDADLDLGLEFDDDPVEPTLHAAEDAEEPDARAAEPEALMAEPAADAVLAATDAIEEVELEADEVSFDLDDEPLEFVDIAAATETTPEVAPPDVVALESTPTVDLDFDSPDEPSLEFDEEIELIADRDGSDSVDDVSLESADEPMTPQASQAMPPPLVDLDDELTFDLEGPVGELDFDIEDSAGPSLATPVASSESASAEAEVELSFDDEMTFSLEEIPGSEETGTVASSESSSASDAFGLAHDDADELEFGLAELDSALANGAAAAMPPTVTPPSSALSDPADELFFDDIETDLLDKKTPDKPTANGAADKSLPKGVPQKEPAKKEAAVGNDDADLDSFLKELGI